MVKFYKLLIIILTLFSVSSIKSQYSAPYSQNFDNMVKLTGFFSSCVSNATLSEGWVNDTSANTWFVDSLKSGSFGTGPSTDHSGTGKYVRIEASSCTSPYIMVSPKINIASLTNPALRFWTHMWNAGGTVLKVYASSDSSTWSQVHIDSSNYSNNWIEFQVSLSSFSGGNVWLKFEAKAKTYEGDIALDEIRVENADPNFVTCLPFSNFTSSNVSFTSASVSWSGGTIPFTVSLIDTAGIVLGSYSTTKQYYDFTALDSGTTYKVIVTSACNSTFKDSATFKTLSVDEFYTCNDQFIDNGTDTANYTNNTNELYMICPNVPGKIVMLDFTEFILEGSGSNACYDYLNFYNGNGINSANVIKTPSGNERWCYESPTDGTYDLANGSPIYSTSTDGCLTIKFKSDGSVNRSGWIANVMCVDPITCFAVDSLKVSNLLANSASINFVDTTGASSWILEYDTNSNFSTSTTITVTTNSNMLSNLIDQMTYYVRVYSICNANDTSFASGSLIFTTPCATITPNYSQTFDSFLPDACWSEFTSGNLITGPTGNSFGDWGSSTLFGNEVRVNLFNANTNDWIVSPNFDLSAGGYDISLDAAIRKYSPTTVGSNMGSDDSVVLAYTEDGNTWNTIKVWTVVDSVPMNLTTYSYPLISTGSNVKFGIYASEGVIDNTEDYYFIIDNFVIEIPNGCPKPLSVNTTGVNNNSATISWSQNSSANNWQIEYGVAGFMSGNGTLVSNVTTNPYTLTGLNSSTEYDVYIRHICNATDTSNWSFSTSFTTDCDAITPDYTQGFDTFLPDSCWREYTDGNLITGPIGSNTGSWGGNSTIMGTTAAINLWSTGKKEWIVTPGFDLSNGGYEVNIDLATRVWSFPSANWSAMGGDDSLVLAYTENGSTWTPIKVWTVADNITMNLSTYTYPLTSTGNFVKFGLYATEGLIDNTEDYYILADNFIIQTIPSCPKPIALMSSNVNSTSADLSWTNNSTATQWEIEYNTAGFVLGTGTKMIITSNPYTLTGLLPNTEYDVYVRGICTANDTSIWSSYTSFKTLCSASTLPYMYGAEDQFVTSSPYNIAECWTDTNSYSYTYYWSTEELSTTSSNTGPDSAYEGSKYFYVEGSGVNKNNNYTAILISPELNMGNNNGLTLSFYYHMYGSAIGKLTAEILKDGVWVAVWDTAGQTHNSKSAPWLRAEASLSGFDTNITKVRFVAYTDSSFMPNTNLWEGDIAIDSITVTGSFVAPCEAVTNVVANGESDVAFNVSFTDANNVGNYIVEYSTSSNFTNSSTKNSTSSPVAITGLTPLTLYYVRVHTICPSGDTMTSTSTNVSTTIGINEITDYNRFVIYPNPTNGFFNLKNLENLSEVNVDIIDVAGKIVYSKKLADNKVNVDLQNGSYIVKLSYDNKIEQHRLIVNK